MRATSSSHLPRYVPSPNSPVPIRLVRRLYLSGHVSGLLSLTVSEHVSGRGTMAPMSDVREELTRDGKAYGRANRARTEARKRLGETIRRAHDEGLGPAEIARLVGSVTEKTVSRIIHGHSKT